MQGFLFKLSNMTKEEIDFRISQLLLDILLSEDMNNIRIDKIKEVFNTYQTKELQQRVDQLQFELKAADSVNEQLQAKIDELEKETLLKIEPALRYFNGFDSEEQNEAAFHALNNLNNYVTNKPKTN